MFWKGGKQGSKESGRHLPNLPCFGNVEDSRQPGQAAWQNGVASDPFKIKVGEGWLQVPNARTQVHAMVWSCPGHMARLSLGKGHLENI